MERGSSAPLRAQIRLTEDVDAGLGPGMTVTQQQAVIEVVQAYLSEILSDLGSSEDDVGGRVSPQFE